MDCWKRSETAMVLGREKECLAHMIIATYGIISQNEDYTNKTDLQQG